jgi:uncharacterized protein
LSRDPLPDALRAVALLGVMLVNAVGYPEAPTGALLGHVARSRVDSMAQFLLASFVQGKAYPLLAMLFGMGLVWAARGHSRAHAQARFSQRQRRLLALGVAHGCFIYFGDILTLYTITAWSVWSTVHVRWPVALRRLWFALCWAFLAVCATVLLAWFAPPWQEGQPATLRRAETAFEFLALNASVYATSTFVGLLLALPVVRLCMLAGIVAARLGLLTRRRWQAWRDRVWWRLFWPAMAANVAYGSSVALAMSRSGDHLQWADAASPLVGLALAAWYALALSRHWHRGHRRWAHALAPLGRRTLSVYVGLSVLCVALFSGVGVGWAPGTPVVALLALALWLALAWAATVSQRRWPLEWWMGRRERSGPFS